MWPTPNRHPVARSRSSSEAASVLPVQRAAITDRDRRPLRAVAATFAINGAVLSSLLPRYPQIVASTGASEATFGLSLAAIGIGGFLGSAVMPALAARVGLTRVVMGAGVLMGVAGLLIALATSVPLLAVAFAFAGAVDGIHDVSMNEVGLGEQSRRARSVMGRLHGAWSVGATVAGAVGALMAGLDVPVAAHMAGVAVVAITAQLVVGRWLRDRPAPVADHRSAVDAVVATPPRRRTVLLVLAAVTLAAFAAEQVALDWSALMLRRGLDASPGLAGLGPLVFSAGVLAGRSVVDPAVDRLGPGRVVRLGNAGAALGLGAGLLAAGMTGLPWPALVGLAIAGIGVSANFPLLFGAGDAVADRLGLPEGTGTSIVGTLPRLGGLVMPAAVGLIASTVGLVPAVGVSAVVAVVVAALLPRILRPR